MWGQLRYSVTSAARRPALAGQDPPVPGDRTGRIVSDHQRSTSCLATDTRDRSVPPGLGWEHRHEAPGTFLGAPVGAAGDVAHGAGCRPTSGRGAARPGPILNVDSGIGIATAPDLTGLEVRGLIDRLETYRPWTEAPGGCWTDRSRTRGGLAHRGPTHNRGNWVGVDGNRS